VHCKLDGSVFPHHSPVSNRLHDIGTQLIHLCRSSGADTITSRVAAPSDFDRIGRNKVMLPTCLVFSSRAESIPAARCQVGSLVAVALLFYFALGVARLRRVQMASNHQSETKSRRDVGRGANALVSLLAQYSDGLQPNFYLHHMSQPTSGNTRPAFLCQ
jgi:hypothetical protein